MLHHEWLLMFLLLESTTSIHNQISNLIVIERFFDIDLIIEMKNNQLSAILSRHQQLLSLSQENNKYTKASWILEELH